MFVHIIICIYIYNLNYRLKITKYEKNNRIISRRPYSAICIRRPPTISLLQQKVKSIFFGTRL